MSKVGLIRDFNAQYNEREANRVNMLSAAGDAFNELEVEVNVLEKSIHKLASKIMKTPMVETDHNSQVEVRDMEDVHLVEDFVINHYPRWVPVYVISTIDQTVENQMLHYCQAKGYSRITRAQLEEQNGGPWEEEIRSFEDDEELRSHKKIGSWPGIVLDSNKPLTCRPGYEDTTMYDDNSDDDDDDDDGDNPDEERAASDDDGVIVDE